MAFYTPLVNNLIFIGLSAFLYLFGADQKLPKGFVIVYHPEIEVDLRYLGSNNFIGKPLPGYFSNKAILTTRAADSLMEVADYLHSRGYKLIIYDAYRPQKAVDYFIEWSKNPSDTLRKQAYYPNINKNRLFEENYIADKSGHSRGSAIDLGLIEIASGRIVDMGTPYDFFGPRSHPLSDKVSDEALENRMILREAMVKHGFDPLSTEWWHFSLKNEPYPKTYFNFDIE